MIIIDEVSKVNWEKIKQLLKIKLPQKGIYIWQSKIIKNSFKKYEKLYEL